MIRLVVSLPLGSFLALFLKSCVVEHLLFDQQSASRVTDFPLFLRIL